MNLFSETQVIHEEETDIHKFFYISKFLQFTGLGMTSVKSLKLHLPKVKCSLASGNNQFLIRYHNYCSIIFSISRNAKFQGRERIIPFELMDYFNMGPLKVRINFELGPTIDIRPLIVLMNRMMNSLANRRNQALEEEATALDGYMISVLVKTIGWMRMKSTYSMTTSYSTPRKTTSTTSMVIKLTV